MLLEESRNIVGGTGNNIVRQQGEGRDFGAGTGEETPEVWNGVATEEELYIGSRRMVNTVVIQLHGFFDEFSVRRRTENFANALEETWKN